MTDEEKAYEILTLLGYRNVPKYRILVGYQSESCVYVEWDFDGTSWAEIPNEFWDDEPPFNKAKNFHRNQEIFDKKGRISYLQREITKIEIEIGRLHREILGLEND